jgi:hypothetical protein
LHDAEFFATDQHILVAAAESNSISHISISHSTSGDIAFSTEWSLTGDISRLDYPTSLSLCLKKRLLGVANRRRTGIAIFSVDTHHFSVDRNPIQVLSEDSLLLQGLAPPHCLAFSPDSRFLFVTHKQFWDATANTSNGKCAIAIYSCTDDPLQPIIPRPILVVPYEHAPTLHSIAIHPNSRIIAVANSIEYPGRSNSGDVDIFLWDPSGPTLSKVHSFSVFRLWEGAKGVSFSPDGTHLSISTELNEILIYSLQNLTL